jgi:inner membrane protein
MPSIITHTAVPIAFACAAGTRKVPPRLLAASMVASILPDADVLGLACGVPYASVFGHRGFFHAPLFALLVSLCGALAWRKLGTSYKSVFAVLFLSMVSHGVLDAATTGGLGIAFLSPFSNHRYFWHWHPIAVSPFGVSQFFGPWGLRVIRSEFLWVWVPCLAISAVGIFLRTYVMMPKKSHQPAADRTRRG